MTKRYTDTKKWTQEWHIKLPIKAKLFWIYVNDKCDDNGVITLDYDKISSDMNLDIDHNILLHFSFSQIHHLEANKYILPGFVESQSE